jgi:hypothetical protein
MFPMFRKKSDIAEDSGEGVEKTPRRPRGVKKAMMVDTMTPLHFHLYDLDSSKTRLSHVLHT